MKICEGKTTLTIRYRISANLLLLGNNDSSPQFIEYNYTETQNI